MQNEEESDDEFYERMIEETEYYQRQEKAYYDMIEETEY